MRKRLSIVVAVSMALATVVSGQKVSCKIKGSDTCLPLVQKESESYQNKNSGSSIVVSGGGSGVGIAALLNGTTDIAMASRKMKMDEKLKLQDAAKVYKEVVIAKDALSVIVNPANKVGQLTREQLEGIFTGKIKNWKEIGGDDLAIVVYSRETSSGTYEFFKEKVLLNKNFASSALLMPATGAVVQSVSQTKGAIGYIGFAYINNSIKTLKISFDKGKSYIEPTTPNAENDIYPITRPLMFYYLKSSESKVASFVNYILSAEGQKIVAEVGYIKLISK